MHHLRQGSNLPARHEGLIDLLGFSNLFSRNLVVSLSFEIGSFPFTALLHTRDTRLLKHPNTKKNHRRRTTSITSKIGLNKS